MANKDTQEVPTSAVERLESKGRRNFLRAGAGAAAVATAATLGVMPIDSGAQESAKDTLERFRRAREAAKNPPPAPLTPPAPIKNNPTVMQPNLAPMTANGEGAFRGFNGNPVDLDSNKFPLKDAKEAYEEMSKLLSTKDGMADFTRLYFINQTATGALAAKKVTFEKVIDKINSMEASSQAETIARLVRDMKGLNDNGSKQSIALEMVRAMMNVFPQAKNLGVKYTRRPTQGSGTQAKAIDLDVNPDNIEPSVTTLRQYLKEHSVMKHIDKDATAYASESPAVDNMFANNGRVRSSGQQSPG